MAGKAQAGKVAPMIVVIAVVVWFVVFKGGVTPKAGTPDAPNAAKSVSTGAAATVANAGQPSTGAKREDVPSAKVPGSAAGAAGAARLKVGAWNIEWLGSPSDRAQFAKDVAQDPATIAEYIVGSGVSVLGVAEVVTPIPGRPIRSRELEAAIEVIKARTGDQWYYALNPGRQDGDQLTGVMWNGRVVTAVGPDGAAWKQATDMPWRVPVRDARSAQNSRLWARPPHAMKFSCGEGKTDFVVIVVHMKADYQGDFAKHRAEEMAALVEALPAVRARFKDEDVVIVGDTNVTSAGEAMVRTLTEAGFADLNAANVRTTWRDGFTDRAFVPKGQPEFRGSEFWVFSDAFLSKMRWKAGDFKKNLSDHFMVGTSIEVMADDD
jgi:hypothetical protein